MGVIKRREFNERGLECWTDTETITYRALGGPLGYKNVIIGPDEGADNVSLRVFLIPKGKHSKEEEHPHDHLVYILEGECNVLLGDELHSVKEGDVVWVKPNEHHRFDNAGEGTLKFICVIPSWGEQDAKRTVPAPASSQE